MAMAAIEMVVGVKRTYIFMLCRRYLSVGWQSDESEHINMLNEEGLTLPSP